MTLSHGGQEIERSRVDQTSKEHGQGGGAEPERRETGPYGRRPQEATVDTVDLAVVIETIAVPGEVQHVERLGERASAPVEGQAERLELPRAVTLPEARFDAPAGEVVDHS